MSLRLLLAVSLGIGIADKLVADNPPPLAKDTLPKIIPVDTMLNAMSAGAITSSMSASLSRSTAASTSPAEGAHASGNSE